MKIATDYLERTEKMKNIQETLMAVESDRTKGDNGISVEELDSYLDSVLSDMEQK